ncbi:uncharacterized protein LOC130998321 [Salvia miltiorrhiza]|uniref:uncharacterized protein LOC130998321 n=1 Tax=Salvia miltiorrhiza TaxID=226208 RepID=UPI0025AD5FAB|nr:uncharacterized protein LOC130998321 [Salvia miltiorrhiza]
MITWIHITLISGFTVVIIVLILILMRKKWSRPITPAQVVITDTQSSHIQTREPSFRHHRQSHLVFRQRKPFFSWSDHPCLAAHAVENGWPSFAFASTDSDHVKEAHVNVEMSWEVFDESVDYMQKIRLNNESTTSLCVIRAALPLPGPQFAHTSFPREAYFEITILSDCHRDFVSDHNAKNDLDCLNEGTNVDSKRNKIAQVKLGGKEEVEDEMVLVAIGLTGGSSYLPLKIPGSFLGSVAFNSTGSVYLDGKKLSEKEEWGREGNVVGCGYNPGQKKVFFTVNSQLVYEIRCKTEEFGQPLYPTLAAKGDVTVVVNLGQSPFRFEAANSQRTQNPCFITKNASCAAPLYELDSKELFSMGRIDGKWRHCTENLTATEFSDQLSEADLFEIVAR